MGALLIAGRELRAYFHTTVGWLVLAGFLLLAGLFWTFMLGFYVEQGMDMLYNPYGAHSMNLGEHLLAPFFGNVSVVLLLLCPALSMRLFSEELKGRTMELLFTSPITTTEIVLGKYLGALGFVALMLLGTMYVPASLMAWGNPDLLVLATGYGAVLLLAAAVLAVGMLCSAATSNQVVALVTAFAASLAFWLLSWVGQDPDSVWSHLSLVGHIEELLRGVVRLSDLVYFAAFIGFFLFATHQRVEAYRWR